MRKSVIYKVLVGAVAVGVLAFAGSALATNGTGTAQAAPTDVTILAPAGTATVTAVDSDAVEFESASEADDATEVSAAEAPETGGVESATEADGPGGHADEPGSPNADHQFEGEE